MDVFLSSTRSNIPGFTLVELLTTLTVGLLILTSGIPGLHRLQANSRQSSEINAFITHFHLARSEAITRSTRITLCPSQDGTNCDDTMNWQRGFILFADNNGNRNRDKQEPVLRIYDEHMDNQISISSTNGRRRLTYLPDGRSPGSNVTITFCDPHNATPPKAIIISNMGRPRVSRHRPDGSALICNSA